MIAVLRGIKRVSYTKKDTGELKQGIEIHCERDPYPTIENCVNGSVIVFSEYISMNDGNHQFINKILDIPLGSTIDIQYIQNGKYSNLADINLYQ